MLIRAMGTECPTEPVHIPPPWTSSGNEADPNGGVRSTLNALKILVRKERLKYVRSQLEKNRRTLQQQLWEVEKLSGERDQQRSSNADDVFSGEVWSLLNHRELVLRRENSQASAGKIPQIFPKLAGNSDARKVVYIGVAKLEAIGRLPSYTVWMFVSRNERMAKDQSIAFRRRISYESNGKETYFCLDAEDGEGQEYLDAEDRDGETKEIHGLTHYEELISRMAITEHGSSSDVLRAIANFFQVPVDKVESKFQSLSTNERRGYRSDSIPLDSRLCHRQSICRSLQQNDDSPLDVHKLLVPIAPQSACSEPKTLTTPLALALDSFDRLFCRRCLIFNCALHSSSCFVAGVNERQRPVVVTGRGLSKQCSPSCQFVSTLSDPAAGVFSDPATPADSAWTSVSVYRRDSALNLSRAAEACSARSKLQADIREGTSKVSNLNMQELDEEQGSQARYGRLSLKELNSADCQAKRVPIIAESLRTKKAKKLSSGFPDVNGEVSVRNLKEAESTSDSTSYAYKREEHSHEAVKFCTYVRSKRGKKHKNNNVRRDEKVGRNSAKSLNEWNGLEKELCEKGIQIFGKNSCLIARNVLKGCKSCQEIADYIRFLDIASDIVGEASPTHRTSSFARRRNMTTMELQIRPSSRRKCRFGRKKAVPKSAALNLCRQYTPCNCEGSFGCEKDCPCVLADTHCEKYCGCFKVCKNRFRGCQCFKSMCDRRQCPCVAAGRECDPDLCKFCWIKCGGPTTSQFCHNMRILQHQKKRVLLARSDVCTGWGVFTRHCLRKNDYIGEYTGELISHAEADRRGRVYDRETSFLFNLNDKLVVDAFRKGNKLKFANHSAHKPNCYTKVLLVGGDHRVGIFAKEKIEAGEELLYDYQYEPEIAPLWATGPG